VGMVGVVDFLFVLKYISKYIYSQLRVLANIVKIIL
jgi:hypothetical protein